MRSTSVAPNTGLKNVWFGALDRGTPVCGTGTSLATVSGQGWLGMGSRVGRADGAERRAGGKAS